MPNFVLTKDIESAQDAADALGREMFPCFQSVTEDGEYSLYTTVSREFDVAELMTGLGIDVEPEYGYRPSPFVAASERLDYEAAHVMAQVEDYWEKREVSDFPEICAEFGSGATEHAICILMDSSAMGDLLCDYFALEAVSETNARHQLSEYMRLLDLADSAYRVAGWEL